MSKMKTYATGLIMMLFIMNEAPPLFTTSGCHMLSHLLKDILYQKACNHSHCGRKAGSTNSLPF